MPSFVYMIVTTLASLLVVPVIAYIYSTQAGFYEILAGHLIKETEPAPIEPEAVPLTTGNETSEMNNDENL